MSLNNESPDVLDSKDTPEDREEEKHDKKHDKVLYSISDYLRIVLDKNGNEVKSYVFTDWKEYVDTYILVCNNHGNIDRICIPASCERYEYKFNCVYDFIVSYFEYARTIGYRDMIDEDREFAQKEAANMPDYKKYKEEYDSFVKCQQYWMFFDRTLSAFVKRSFFVDGKYETEDLYNPVKLAIIMKLIPDKNLVSFYQTLADKISPYYILFFHDVSYNIDNIRKWNHAYHYQRAKLSDGDKEEYSKHNKSMKEIEKYLSLKDIGKIIRKCYMYDSFYRDYIFRITEEFEREFEEALRPGGSIFLKCKERFEKLNK